MDKNKFKLTQYGTFPGNLVIVGFGSIAHATIPLLLRHFSLQPAHITVIAPDAAGKKLADTFGVRYCQEAIIPENLEECLAPLLKKGDFLLNLSVDVSSKELVLFCQRRGVLYLDSCIEPWRGGYTDPNLSLSERSNYALREEMLELRKECLSGSTALVAYGANPGLISQLTKQALLHVANDVHESYEQQPSTQEEWALLAKRLNIFTIHIAERDTQVAKRPKVVGEFVNTWSVDGFVGEGCQPAELGWGTHEKKLPHDGQHHTFGCGSAIYLTRPGASIRVRTWTPTGPQHGFLITHNESIALADYYTYKEGDQVVYRPTVHYAYHPCNDAVLSIHELAARNWQQQASKRILMDDIEEGYDELGVLLMGHPKGAYWYGSRLSIEEARRLAPYNNGTSLQVAAAILAGVVFVIQNPQRGIVEADDLDFKQQLAIARPYLGQVFGEYSNWTPIQDRGELFPEAIDAANIWQFDNFRVE